MPSPTATMGLRKAVDADNARTYLASDLGFSLDLLDAHDHSGAALGGPLGANTVATAMVVDLAITTGKLADDAVTAAKIAAGAVGTSELADSSVTETKLAADAAAAIVYQRDWLGL